MGKRSEVIFGNRMSSQVVKKAENSKERFVRKFGDDSEVDYPLAIVKNLYIGGSLGVSNIVIDGGDSEDESAGGREEFRDIPHTLQMMKLFMQDDSILTDMCENIKRNKADGIYDGAYEVVKQAMNMKK